MNLKHVCFLIFKPFIVFGQTKIKEVNHVFRCWTNILRLGGEKTNCNKTINKEVDKKRTALHTVTDDKWGKFRLMTE